MSDSVQSFSATVESDRECLASWRRYPGVESLRPMVERYLAFVYSSAYRRIGNAVQAAEVTRAVFLVLARRGRKLRKKTILAGWLFEVTAIACRKLLPKRSRWDWLKRPKRSESSPNASAGAKSPPPPLPTPGGGSSLSPSSFGGTESGPASFAPPPRHPAIV